MNNFTKCIFFLCLLSLSAPIYSQNVGINTTGGTPSNNAILDLNTGNSNNLGLLIPNVTLGALLSTFNPPMANAANAGDKGMLVFNSSATNQPIGYYYWNGSAWVSTSASAWQLTGNSGTSPGTNFIGTTDLQAFEFKVDNQKAGWLDYTSPYNTFFGSEAGNSISGGIANTATGYRALFSNSTGNYNTAIGDSALSTNGTGSYNTAAGMGALFTNSSGNFNTATGGLALSSNISGSYNTATGLEALFSNNSGISNTAAGFSSLFLNTTGSSNSAMGFYALYSNIADANTAEGDSALYANTSGIANTAVGAYALPVNASGSSSTALGNEAGLKSTGSKNVFIGDSAGYTNTTGTNNTLIGYQANVSGNGLTNATAIGNGASVSASNSMQLGNTSVVTITSSGNNITYNPTLVAINATATATAAQIVSGYITSTSAATTTITLPTAASLATQIQGSGAAVARGTSLCFTVDNTAGTKVVTVAVNTGITAITAVINGSATLTVNNGTLGVFEIIYITSSTAKLIRVD